MQLDKTRVAIRERGVLDILDLSLHIVRDHAVPLIKTSAFCIIPLMLLNHGLLRWMLEDVKFGIMAEQQDRVQVTRYMWNLALLTMIEAPLVSLLSTVYLGKAVFNQESSLWQTLKEVLRMTPQLAWCLLIVRGIGFAILLTLAISSYTSFSTAEGFLIILAIYVALVRALRPYINEIILLERNPLWSRTRHGQTIARRSMLLHGPSGGDLFGRWLCSALIGTLLVASIYGSCVFLAGVFFARWRPGPLMIQVAFPLSMWIAAAYFAVVRYLSYLDLRIRHEGWEVELRMRAEAARLASKMV